MNISAKQLTYLNTLNRDFAKQLQRRPMATKVKESESRKLRRMALVLRKWRHG